MLDQHLRDRFKNRQEVLSFFSFLEQLQIGKIHLGRLQFMIELDQLLDKLRILTQGPVNFEILLLHLGKSFKKQHAETDIIQGLLLKNLIQDEITSHLSKARDGNGKRSLTF